MTAINFTVLLDKVEDGTKRQTIRQAKCIGYPKSCEGYDFDAWDAWPKRLGHPNCIFHPYAKEKGYCIEYKNRIKPGDTLQLYTGLRQRKYCKNPRWGYREQICEGYTDYKSRKCGYAGDWKCGRQGAKLLKTATCTESFPIKFENLTEEIARLDGFEHIPWGEPTKYGQSLASPLAGLKYFLEKTYDAKDGDVFQIIRWKE